MAADERNQDQHPATGDDLLVELASNGELDGNGVPVYRAREVRSNRAELERSLVHRSVKRPLLPYQQALCEALGISEAEYHEFLAIQRDWRPSQEERLAIVRADPVSIVLFVVGVVFQIVGALLAPRLEEPKNRPQSRNQRFSPRYGFNSTQELARYGDPINLVYCDKNINPRGVVRVGTSLIWSAVESYGSAQFMQLLLVVGAASVRSIDANKTAFGQLPLGQFIASNTWVYYHKSGGPVRFFNKLFGTVRDPARNWQSVEYVVHQIRDGDNWHTGYSQAYTPTSKTTFGVYSPIPINVQLGERRQSGRLRWANNEIELENGSYNTTLNGGWVAGNQFKIIFRQATTKKDNLAQEAAKDMRYQLVSALDIGSLYQLGSARFKLNWISSNVDLDKGGVSAQLECVERGRRPTTLYSDTKVKRYDDELAKIEDAFDRLRSKASTYTGSVDKESIQNFVFPPKTAGQNSNIKPSPFWFPPSSYEQSDEEKYDRLLSTEFGFSFGKIKYNFAGSVTVSWTDDLDQKQSFTFPRGGSLEYTRNILETFLADKPKLKTKLLRQEYDDDLEKARDLRDATTAGEYNKKFRNEAKSEQIAQEIKQEIRYRQGRRRWSEGEAKLYSNDRIKELEDKIDDEKDRKNPDKDKIRRWRKEIKDIRNDRQLGDKGTKQYSDERIDDLQDARQDFLDGRVGEKKKSYVFFIRNASTPFYGLDGNRYACGIKCLKRRLNNLKGEWTTDQWGVYKVRSALRALIKEKEQAIRDAKWLIKNWDTLVRDVDDAFFVKCLVKVDIANYQTVSACDYVKLNIRARLFRRIQGRAKVYGAKDAPDGYRYSDNGVKGRMAFFDIKYRALGGEWKRVPTIFMVRNAADADIFLTIKFETKGPKKKWEFELSPISDPPREIREHGYPSYSMLTTGGNRARVTVGSESFAFIGSIEAVDWNLFPKLKERGPLYTNEWDLFSPRSDTEMQASFDQGPELELVNVTEQQKCSISDKYRNLSLLAIHTFSGAGVQDLRNVTAYVTEGKECWFVDESTGAYTKTNRSTSWAPDIFADTVLDDLNGIGKFANPAGVDWQGLAKAKRFCRNNGLGCQLFMDGVIADRISWREFWVEVAPYSLLEFARINGRETLLPALPVDSNGRATTQLEISALFNQGNILEGSYKEEFLDYGDNTQDLVATVIYRDTLRDEIFAKNDSVTLARSDTNTGTALWQTFDLSDWVTQRKQAVLYGRYLCQQRRYLRRGIEFKTIPTDAPIGPGAYIFVDIGLNSWDLVRTGVVEEGGRLNTPLTTSIPDNTYNAITYRSGDKPIQQSVTVSKGVAPQLANRAGCLFSLGITRTAKRVFRVSEVSMEEDGTTTIKAIEYPADSQLRSLAADLSDSLFVEIGATC